MDGERAEGGQGRRNTFIQPGTGVGAEGMAWRYRTVLPFYCWRRIVRFVCDWHDNEREFGGSQRTLHVWWYVAFLRGDAEGVVVG